MRYIIPNIVVISPVQMLPPTRVITATIPEIMRNKPAINTNMAATKLNRLGLKIKPRPKIRAITPNVNSTMPRKLLSSNVVIPIAMRPIPKNNNARPVITLNGTIPNTGKAIIIRPRIIRINALPTFRSITSTSHLSISILIKF